MQNVNVSVDFSKIIGRIKPMHAVGQPPFRSGIGTFDLTPMQILKDANIPYSRMHDVGGAFGGNRFVDIPNIFRNFDADENDPNSYDFVFTDVIIKGLMDYGIEPYFRLGVTIENQSFIKAYHIHPPKDYGKWARICEHIVRHYNEGWANGYKFNIKYWEIWNEPENREVPELNQMWTGTPEQYYELFSVTAKHLKKCFGDKIKVGGYGASGFYGIFSNPEKYRMSFARRDEVRYNSPKEEYRLSFFFGFIEYIKKHNSPIDFFSWHTYSDVNTIPLEADFVEKVLKENGLGNIETHLNEWNLSHDIKINTGTSYASANVLAVMLAMQRKKTDMLMYYDAKYLSLNAYAGLYDVKTGMPSNIYYALKAFGELYHLQNEVECNYSSSGVYALAAAKDDEKAILLSNVKEDANVEINLSNEFFVYIIDKENLCVKKEVNPTKFTLAKNTIAFIKNY